MKRTVTAMAVVAAVIAFGTGCGAAAAPNTALAADAQPTAAATAPPAREDSGPAGIVTGHEERPVCDAKDCAMKLFIVMLPADGGNTDPVNVAATEDDLGNCPENSFYPTCKN